jgi:hypothetical protein
MSSDSSAVDRSRDVPPWKISFSPLVTFLGCALTAVLFAALLFAWLTFVVPDDVLADSSSPARITVVVGLMAGALLLMFGPFVALLVGRLLRRSGSTAVHVVAFTFTGSLVGFLGGALLGPDVAASMLVTLGLATGITRLALTPFARERFTQD